MTLYKCRQLANRTYSHNFILFWYIANKNLGQILLGDRKICTYTNTNECLTLLYLVGIGFGKFHMTDTTTSHSCQYTSLRNIWFRFSFIFELKRILLIKCYTPLWTLSDCLKKFLKSYSMTQLLISLKLYLIFLLI